MSVPIICPPCLKSYLHILQCCAFNHFPHTSTDVFWHLQQTTSRNIAAKGEKLLIMNNFSFCHNVFNWFKCYIFIYRNVSNLNPDNFKIVCCWFVVCGKGSSREQCFAFKQNALNLWITYHKQFSMVIFSDNSLKSLLPAKIQLYFSTYRHILKTLQQTTFENIVAIPSFAITFSTLF